MLKSGFVFMLCLVFLWANSLDAQVRPPIFPEDIESTSLSQKVYEHSSVRNKSRSKGLDLTFTRVLGATINGEDEVLQEPLSATDALDNLSLKLKVPVIRGEKFKLLLGYRYQSEKYQFSRIGANFGEVFQRMDDLKLKNSGFGIIGLYRFTPNIAVSGRVQGLYKGDYEGLINFDDRYAVYQIQLAVDVRRREDVEWGVGFNFSHSFRRTIAIPFFMYNRTFNDHWGIELALPAAIIVRYNFSPKSLLLFGPKFNSKSYSIDLPLLNGGGNEIYNLNHSEIRLSLELEQEIRPWIWFNAEAGFQYNFSTDFEVPNNENLSFMVEPGHTPFFKVGLFVSPPNKYMK